MSNALAQLVSALPAWLLGGLVALLVGCVILAVRAPMLVKLGIRNIGRRRLRAMLVVGGLMLSSMVLVGALGTGDTITHTLRRVVAGSLGTVDEVVVRNPPRGRLRARVQALAEPGFGGLASAQLEVFPESDIAFLPGTLRGSRVIAGVAPAIIEQVTVVHSTSQRLRAAHPLLALGTSLPAAIGPLVGVDGSVIAWDELGSDEVVLNAAAANVFGAQAGDQLALRWGGTSWNVRVHAVASSAGIAGAQPLLLVPLSSYQRATERPAQINALLVANHGGSAGVTHSAAAAGALRWRLADHQAAQELHQIFARPDVQRALRQVEELLQARDRERIAELRAEAARPEMTESFVSLVSEPRTRGRLISLAWRFPGVGSRAGRLLQNVSTLSVLEVKHEALEQAREYGAVVTTVFLVLGIFSIAASILLIFLIFALLAADRGSELATLRAIGMRRRQIMAVFLAEGMAYNLAGAILGAVVGVAAGYGLVLGLAQALSTFGIELRPYIGPWSVALGTVGGLLLTFGAMLLAVWRIARIGIVGGLRGELAPERQQSIVGPLLLLGAAGAAWWLGWRATLSPEAKLLTMPVVWSLVAVGGVSIVKRTLRRILDGARAWLVDVANLLTTTVVVASWLRCLLELPERSADITNSALVLALAGVVLTLATAWLAAQGLGPLLHLLDVGLAALPRLRAIVRPAAGFLGRQRSRSGITVVLFSMVVMIIVTTLSLIDVVTRAYGRDEPPVAGFDLRADVQGGTLPDMEVALAQAPAVSRAAFDAIGSVTTQEASAVQLGLSRAAWQDATLAVVDAGFLEGIQADIVQRAPGFSSPRAVWTALEQRPGTAVVTGQSVDGVVLPKSTEPAPFQPVTVWLAGPGELPVRLTIIGVVDPRSELAPGIYTGRPSVSGMTLPAPQTYFFSLSQGVPVRDIAEGLRVSFDDQGLTVTVLGEVQRLIRAVRLLLVQLVQGFMGIGLLAGIAALGLLGVQGVLERRQQLATLRALGFTGGQIRAMLVVESCAIAATGVGLGVVVGLLVARTLVGVLTAHYPELRFGAPWREIAVVISVTWLGSSGMTLVAAWQGGRVAPAEALRVV